MARLVDIHSIKILFHLSSNILPWSVGKAILVYTAGMIVKQEKIPTSVEYIGSISDVSEHLKINAFGVRAERKTHEDFSPANAFYPLYNIQRIYCI